MSWFYSRHLMLGGEPVKCYHCKQPMVADPQPTRESDIAKWKGVCLDCEVNMGKRAEAELAIDDLIRERGVARRLMDGWRSIFG